MHDATRLNGDIRTLNRLAAEIRQRETLEEQVEALHALRQTNSYVTAHVFERLDLPNRLVHPLLCEVLRDKQSHTKAWLRSAVSRAGICPVVEWTLRLEEELPPTRFNLIVYQLTWIVAKTLRDDPQQGAKSRRCAERVYARMDRQKRR